MRVCKLCGNEIQKWQSYELDGTSVHHMACILRQTPAQVPGFRYPGDSNLMLHRHKDDARRFNIPSHERKEMEDE
jgi:hypothetical protein